MDIQAVKEANPLDVIAERLTGQQATKHKIKCPFHDDKSPSLHLYDDGGWKCFGCGRHGDVLDFVGLYLKGTTYDPAQHLLEVIDYLGGIDIRPLQRAERPASQPTEPRTEHTTFPPDRVMFWHASLMPEHRRYWHSRGLSDETIDKFRLGWDGDRLTIPVCYRGLCYGIKKRAWGDAQPKYTMAKGSHVGLFNADILTILHGGDIPLFIVEGEVEAMLLDQLGYPSISSTGGAGTFKPHWATFLAHLDRIIVIYDNDAPGMAGALRVRALLRRAQIAKWPSGFKDGGEFLPTDGAWEWLNSLLTF